MSLDLLNKKQQAGLGAGKD